MPKDSSGLTPVSPKVTTKTSKRGPKPGTPRAGGMPKGYVYPQTIAKEEAKALMRQIVLEELRPLVRSQIDSARGIAHFMLRDPETGMFKRLTDPSEIEQALNAPGATEGSTYWVYTKDPHTPAFVTLMDRVIGKPTEEVQMDVTVNDPLADRLKRAKERVDKA